MGNPAIETHELTRCYGDIVALDHLSLTIPQGEIFGFLGHNGAGKTTTVNLLTTLILPTSGKAEVGGHDIVRDNLAVRQCIGYVPENVRLYNDLSVEENLAFFATLSGVENVPRRITEVLALLGRLTWRDSRVGGFSKGMRQRIGIAQALLHRPEVLFMDEPSSGLDPEGAHEIEDLIVRPQSRIRHHHLYEYASTRPGDQDVHEYRDTEPWPSGGLGFADNLVSRFANDHSLEEIYLHFEHNGWTGGTGDAA